MEQRQEAHEEIISRALGAMHRTPTGELRYELLQGGVSGSYTYRIEAARDDLVLKATLPGCAPYVMQRARREVFFYRHLAHKIPLRVPQVLDTFLMDESAGTPVYFLMPRYRPSEPPGEWSEAQYIEAAEQLGRFQAAFW